MEKSRYLHVFSKRGRMGVGFVAALDFAIVGFIRCVNMGMFLPITAIRESTIATRKFALERFFA